MCGECGWGKGGWEGAQDVDVFPGVGMCSGVESGCEVAK